MKFGDFEKKERISSLERIQRTMEKRYGRNSSFLLGLYAKRTFLTMFILQNGIDVFVQFVGNVSAHDGCNDDQRFVHLLILRVLVVNAREKRFVISSLYRHYFKNTLICSQLVWCFIFHRGKYNDDTPIYAPIIIIIVITIVWKFFRLSIIESQIHKDSSLSFLLLCQILEQAWINWERSFRLKD